MTRRMALLARDLARADDAGALRLAGTITQEEGGLFVVAGWVANENAASLADLAQRRGVAIWLGPPEESDSPPTLLRPPATMAAGADLARLYQLPGAREWDPSAALFVSFCAFFALILSDAGYSALLFAAALVATPWARRSALGARLHTLWLAACALSLAWGVVVGSYFGADPPHPILAQAQLVSLNDYNAMMMLTVLIGAAHVGFANIAAAWVRRGTRVQWGPLGWMTLIAAAVMWWFLPEARSVAYGVAALAGLMIVIGAGGIIKGMIALTKATALLADVLSYLRLFALGLASASLAVAFNDLAGQARDAAGPLGLPAFILVLLIGHGLNLALSVMSGVVHGLRLNLIEFYNWGVSEEGRVFAPFARTAQGAV